MSKLISGKEAIEAFLNGNDVEFSVCGSTWENALNVNIGVFLNTSKFNDFKFRLKPQTITINGINIAKPKKIELTNIFTITMEFDDHNEALKANKALKIVFKPQ